MILLQLVCVVIVVSYVAIRASRAEDKALALSRLAILAVTGWIGEDGVIRAYGFYGYSRGWSFFLDRTPLLIVLIWPAVIDSAHLLARRLVPRGTPLVIAAVAGVIVLSDASLIEPIAVHAGLWSWVRSGIFDVPPVGIVGWAYFAAAAVGTFEVIDARRAREASSARSAGRGGLASLVVLLVAPAATHVALVGSWWLLFKWFPGDAAPWTVAVASWAVLTPVALTAWAKRAGQRVPLAELMARAPGAVFFFVLLAASARDDGPLLVYAIAFALPYFALLAHRARLAPRSRAPAAGVD